MCSSLRRTSRRGSREVQTRDPDEGLRSLRGGGQPGFTEAALAPCFSPKPFRKEFIPVVSALS
jgi:hypothetical protein